MMKKGLIIGGILVGCLMLFMAVGAFAANPTGPTGVSVSATLSSGLQLTMSSTSIDFGTVAPWSTTPASTTATVNSNKAWSLRAQKNTDLTTGTYTIPSENLTYTSTTTTPATVHNTVVASTQFSTTTAAVCSGCDKGSSMTLTMNYSLTVPWTNEPGTYTATHTYTATQP